MLKNTKLVLLFVFGLGLLGNANAAESVENTHNQTTRQKIKQGLLLSGISLSSCFGSRSFLEVARNCMNFCKVEDSVVRDIILKAYPEATAEEIVKYTPEVRAALEGVRKYTTVGNLFAAVLLAASGYTFYNLLTEDAEKEDTQKNKCTRRTMALAAAIIGAGCAVHHFSR